MSRRDLFVGAAIGGAAAIAMGQEGAAANVGSVSPHSDGTDSMSQRPRFHFSVPDNWKNDPQRPVFVNGEYLYYYLYNADYIAGADGGTAWRLSTTRDHVSFVDRGVAIPKLTDDNGDCWSGSVVVDTGNTAGFGENALVALVTQAPQAVQAQYLWYSTDGGRSFTARGGDPVLANPGVSDFRDPKVVRDEERDRWVLVNAEGTSLGFYTSDDLSSWTRAGSFERDDLGVLECPDLFRMTADDGSVHWVLGMSANGKGRGLPATYAYWVGAFDGASFVPRADEPQWLDHGFDFYGAVTYPHHAADGTEDSALRHVIGWANFWDYPHSTPTTATDGYNGDDMIVRDVRLVATDDGCYLASEPTAALASYAKSARSLGDVTVSSGTRDLDVRSIAYELTTTLSWDPAAAPENIGLEVCRATSGVRKVSLGAYVAGGFAYVNRGPAFSPAAGESQTPIDASTGSLAIRLLVDRTSVELFVGDGRHVHSHRVFPLTSDDRIQLFVSGGEATYRDLTVRDLSVC
ncbi:MAG: glycoside hydrolase family 32 protein [Microbacterium sp.]